MASCERDVYGEFRVNYLAQLSGRCIKINDRHIKGISDLYTCCQDFGSTWIEVKFLLLPKTPGFPLRLALTELQRKWIADEQAAGGKAGWLLCVKREKDWIYYASSDSTVERVAQDSDHVVRSRGKSLDVRRLMEMIHFK